MQVTYFPYLNLKDRDEISFGDIKIWNIDRVAEKYISDSTLRDKIIKLLHSNVKNNRAIQDIGVLSIGRTDFRSFNSEEFEIADEARLMMFLGFLGRNNVNASGLNAGHYIATSENFTFVVQNFDPNSEYISQQNGFIVRKLDGGYTIGQLLFHAPPYVTQPLQFNLDGDLISQLLKIKKRNKSFFKKIIRATDLMFESYFNDPYLSINARALLMTAAFEVLLDLPERDQRLTFKNKIKQYGNISGNPKARYTSERGTRKVWETETIKVMWADKFYTLRNHIIHGQRVKWSEFMFRGSQSHFDIAPLFFVFLIKQLLNEKLGKVFFYDDQLTTSFKSTFC